MKNALLIVLLLNCLIAAQVQDTTKEKPVQYRRGITLEKNFISYEQKYAGKNLNEEKRRLFPLQGGTGVWTELNPKVPRVDYLGIHFINPDTGWAVGDLGALIKTTDGGESWEVKETNTTTPILKVRSYNGQTVMASGFDGLILRSTDGGESWEQVTSGVTGDLWGLQMLNDTLGWACGNANSLIKSTDGGLSWQNIETPGYTSDYWWIDFLNESYGFIAANGKVLRTIDGGLNWEIIQAGDSQALFTIDVIDSVHIAAAGYGGTGYSGKNIYSSDGGDTWINGGGLTTESVNCIQYVNLDTGYVIMTDVIGKKTTNRGQDWTGIALGGEYEMQFFNIENLGYSAGTELRVYKTENGYENWKRLIINDNFSDVFFVNEQKGFVISSSGLSSPSGLYKTTDGGIHWEKVSGAPDGTELLFLDSLTGFIGSTQIYKTTDGGVNWYVPNGGQGGAGKIFFINQEIGWAVRSNVIYKTIDRGENWYVQFTALPGISFTSIHFVDSLYGWTADSDRPFKTTDGGENWIEQINLNIWGSDDIYFPSLDTGWIGRYSSINNSLFKTTDGGTNWIAISEVVGARKIYLFPDPIHWLTIGFSRYYFTNDYGNNWLEFTEDVPTGLVSFYAPSNYFAYAVGNVGLILRYDDTTYIPVELTSFSVSTNKGYVELKWITATETNNSGFEILRSTDNKNWDRVGVVSGNGTSTYQHSYQFIDDVKIAGVYYYKLKQIDYNGGFNFSNIVEVNIIQPLSFLLSQNYPNPFNPSTVINYAIKEAGLVKIKVYDILGNEVAVLVNETKEAGYHSVKFNASKLPSGVYIYTLQAGSFSDVKKMILIK